MRAFFPALCVLGIRVVGADEPTDCKREPQRHVKGVLDWGWTEGTNTVTGDCEPDGDQFFTGSVTATCDDGGNTWSLSNGGKCEECLLPEGVTKVEDTFKCLTKDTGAVLETPACDLEEDKPVFNWNTDTCVQAPCKVLPVSDDSSTWDWDTGTKFVNVDEALEQSCGGVKPDATRSATCGAYGWTMASDCAQAACTVAPTAQDGVQWDALPDGGVEVDASLDGTCSEHTTGTVSATCGSAGWTVSQDCVCDNTIDADQQLMYASLTEAQSVKWFPVDGECVACAETAWTDGVCSPFYAHAAPVCGEHGTDVGLAQCLCDTQFFGQTCINAVKACNLDHSTWHWDEDKAEQSCECRDDYTGDLCDAPPAPAAAAGLDEACNDSTVCQTDLKCDNQVCRGDQGYECSDENTCAADLFCYSAENTCKKDEICGMVVAEGSAKKMSDLLDAADWKIEKQREENVSVAGNQLTIMTTGGTTPALETCASLAQVLKELNPQPFKNCDGHLLLSCSVLPETTAASTATQAPPASTMPDLMNTRYLYPLAGMLAVTTALWLAVRYWRSRQLMLQGGSVDNDDDFEDSETGLRDSARPMSRAPAVDFSATRSAVEMQSSAQPSMRVSDKTSSKQFLETVLRAKNYPPYTWSRYTELLRVNFISTAEQLRGMDAGDWNLLELPEEVMVDMQKRLGTYGKLQQAHNGEHDATTAPTATTTKKKTKKKKKKKTTKHTGDDDTSAAAASSFDGFDFDEPLPDFS